MLKNIYIDIEQMIKEGVQKSEQESGHQMVPGNNGQFVDAHFSGGGDLDLGPCQVESLLVLRTDSDTLRTIENLETENEVLNRIQWKPRGDRK